MKFTAVITALACAEAALGARFTEARRQRHAERAAAKREATRNSNPRLPADDSITQGLAFDNETQVSYSSNWAGAVLIGSVSSWHAKNHENLLIHMAGIQVCDWHLCRPDTL